jgi:hypothetical protein
MSALFDQMLAYQLAKAACGSDGTLEAFLAAIAVFTAAMYPLGPQDWQLFAILAFLSGNVSVLVHILGEDKFSWNAQLTKIEESLSDDADIRRIANYKAWIEEDLKNVFRSIARNPYTEEARAHLIRVLKDNECWRTFAAAKATECCKPKMLEDVLDVIGNGKIIQVREHVALYNSILSTIRALPDSEDKNDMYWLVIDMFNVKRELPLRRVSRRSLKLLQ